MTLVFRTDLSNIIKGYWTIYITPSQDLSRDFENIILSSMSDLYNVTEVDDFRKILTYKRMKILNTDVFIYFSTLAVKRSRNDEFRVDIYFRKMLIIMLFMAAGFVLLLRQFGIMAAISFSALIFMISLSFLIMGRAFRASLLERVNAQVELRNSSDVT